MTGNSNPNQPETTGCDSLRGQDQLNDQVGNWENWIDEFKKEHKNCFTWLVKLFPVPSSSATQQQSVKYLIDSIQDPKTFLERFLEIYEYVVTLQNKKQQLENECSRLINNHTYYNQNHSYLQQENTKLKNEVHRLEQENHRRATQLQARIEELQKEKEKLCKERSSLLGKLSDRDRDKTCTVTSNNSRRQRDVLTQDFTHLNNQEFNAASNQIFNHRCEAKPHLKANRKLEIASIKSIFSKGILKTANKFFVNNNSIQPEDFPRATEWCTEFLLKDLEMPTRANCPEAILKTLENLVGKGLMLVKDIVNDEPPGELFIEDEGTVFNSEIHQPVPGCDPSGRILYTTYAGYRVNNHIIGEALKAFVFTVPEEEFGSVKSVSNIENKQLANENDSANTSTDAENTQSVDSNSVPDEATQSVEASSFQVQQPTEQPSLTNDGIHPQTFTGTVIVGGNAQLSLCNSRKLHDRSDQKVSNKEFLTFDAWAKGEMVEANEQKHDSWFRVANKNLWLPKVYIHVNES